MKLCAQLINSWISDFSVNSAYSVRKAVFGRILSGDLTQKKVDRTVNFMYGSPLISTVYSVKTQCFRA